jgi:hypothetical protein
VVSAAAGAAGVGLAGKLGQIGGLIADAAISVASTSAKGESVTALGVLADVGAGKAASAGMKHAIESRSSHKTALRQVDRLERIGNKPGARTAQRERAENARPTLERTVEQQAAQAGVVGSGVGSAAERHISERLREGSAK